MQQPHLDFFLNTHISDIGVQDKRVVWLEGFQQRSELRVHIEADYVIDATGDGTVGARMGVPFFLGEKEIDDGTDLSQVQGSSILYYTRKEDHAVPFLKPDYAYDIEHIEKLLGQGGRIVSEIMTGSDCWWFEYGGTLDTIRDDQAINLELRRLVLGVWNYIKNSGKFQANCYTLEWLGAIPGKRESRRMKTEHLLSSQDIRACRHFQDAAFYGGWYMDYHPAGGIWDSGRENCVQVPVSVYQIPLGTLYNRDYPNLLFAGRDIGTLRDAFVSSRIMNTCALSGQAAGTLAWMCLKSGHPPAQLSEEEIKTVRWTLLREDMMIPGLQALDPQDLALSARVTASSTHGGGYGSIVEWYPLNQGGFVVFPGREGRLTVQTDKPVCLKAALYRSCLPNRKIPGEPLRELSWELNPGRQNISCTASGTSQGFCRIEFQPATGVFLGLTREGRTGFLCGQSQRPEYFEPAVVCSEDMLYSPENVVNGWLRPWAMPHLWSPEKGDATPWLELTWETAVTVGELRIYLDPELSMELPSSRASHWEDSHGFAVRKGMPRQLLRDFRLTVQGEDGPSQVAEVHDNDQRLVVISLDPPRQIRTLRLEVERTWGDAPASIFEIAAFETPL